MQCLHVYWEMTQPNVYTIDHVARTKCRVYYTSHSLRCPPPEGGRVEAGEAIEGFVILTTKKNMVCLARGDVFGATESDHGLRFEHSVH